MVRKPFYQKQYYTAFLGGKAAMPLISGIIKRSIRFIRNKYKFACFTGTGGDFYAFIKRRFPKGNHPADP